MHCTYTNTRRGRIEIEKQTDPAGGTGFGFTSNLPGPNDVSRRQRAAERQQPEPPGSYQVTEDDPRPGYDLTNLVCTDPSGGTTTSLLARRASIDLAPGETVHCTYTNTRRGRIEIEKQTDPAGGTGFGFTSNLPGPNDASRSTTTGSRTPTTCSRAPIRSPRTTRGRAMTSRTWSAPIPPAGPPPRCSPAGPASTWPPGETVHCTYTNTRRGRIEIEKQTDPAGGTGFGFTSNLPGPNDVFSLDDNGQQNANNLLPGSYQVTEDDPRPGYDLTNLVCTDPSGGTTTSLLARRASIDLAPGETVHCTYTNTRRGRIEIEKQTDPAGGTGFGFTSNLPGPNDVFSLDDNGQQNANNLLPGSYQVTEDDPRPGYDLTNLVCTDPSGGTTTSLLARRASIDLAPGETVHCTYTNTRRGRIIVEKITDDGNGSFEFTSDTLTPSPFTLTTTGAGAANKDSRPFGNLVPDLYDVAETVPDGWNLVSGTCDDGSDPAAIDLSPGETVTCTFHDARETGAIRITKLRKHAVDGPGDHPHAGVDFTITGGELPAGGVTRTTNANGRICLDGLVLSSHAGVGNYTVHEVLPAGYHGEADKIVTVDNEATCGDVPYVGESRTFHNTPLTDITVTVNSQIGGGTASTIDCVDAADPPNTVASGTTGADGDGDATALDLEPGTYTCTVVVDP